jgi:hypothetical protein
VCPLSVPQGKHIEEEWLHIKVKCLVLEEELSHEAEVLAVHLVLLSVHLKERDTLVAIDLVPGWVAPTTYPLNERGKEVR